MTEPTPPKIKVRTRPWDMIQSCLYEHRTVTIRNLLCNYFTLKFLSCKELHTNFGVLQKSAFAFLYKFTIKTQFYLRMAFAMSCLIYLFSKSIHSVASYAFALASTKSLPRAVMPSTRPPFVTISPLSFFAVPAWKQ